MSYLTALEAALKKEGSDDALAAKVLAIAKPGVLLQKQFKSPIAERPPLWGLFKRGPIETRQGLPVATGASRIGGLPELPAGISWPMHKGKPMQFLAQINCAELMEFREHTQLPESGTFHFFFELRGTKSATIYTPAGVASQTTKAPAVTGAHNFVLPQFPVTFTLVPTLPHVESKAFAELNLDEGDAELVINAHVGHLEEYRRKEHALHMVSGYPEAVQGDVFTECAKYSSSEKRSWDIAAQESPHWRLLFQFDTDGDMDFMWGDAGTIYFCIHEDDLRAGRFDKVVSTAQCG